jgi:acetolactate synthase-1/2/3 large subunit
MTTSDEGAVDRRDFLKKAAGSAAAIVASTHVMNGQNSEPTLTAPVVEEDAPFLTTESPGSDFMVEVLKTLDFEFISANPASSFRSLQESFVNYGKNKNPEWLTAMHEESSVGMARGYFQIEGKPMAVAAHGTVGLQHAAIGIYHAYCARVPVYIILGNTFDATLRRERAEWRHSVQDAALMVRDYVKWDDMPVSLGHFAESAVRAYKIAMTPPMGPVIVVTDSVLQEKPMENRAQLRIPKLTVPSLPAGDSGAVAELAELLVNADELAILGGELGRTQNSIDLLVELAETLQAPVSGGGFPSRHPLSGGANVRRSDVILALESTDLWGDVNTMVDVSRSSRSNLKPGAKLLSISPTDLYMKSNYQNFMRYQEAHLAIAASAEATLPSLIDACKRLITADRRNFLAERGKKVAAANLARRERARTEAAAVWDLSPISPARIAYELWEQIKNKDWSLVNGAGETRDVWNFDKHYRSIGGGQGASSGAPAALGAALANRKHGRLSISIQNDGDLMYAPGVLWTAAHHRIPMLTIMNNNRAYHEEVMHLQTMACRHNRDLTTAHVGNAIDDPNIDYAKLAQSMGWYAEGPILDPNEVGPALKRAIARVEAGEPALLDTVMQPR